MRQKEKTRSEEQDNFLKLLLYTLLFLLRDSDDQRHNHIIKN